MFVQQIQAGGDETQPVFHLQHISCFTSCSTSVFHSAASPLSVRLLEFQRRVVGDTASPPQACVIDSVFSASCSSCVGLIRVLPDFVPACDSFITACHCARRMWGWWSLCVSAVVINRKQPLEISNYMKNSVYLSVNTKHTITPLFSCIIYESFLNARIVSLLCVFKCFSLLLCLDSLSVILLCNTCSNMSHK